MNNKENNKLSSEENEKEKIRYSDRVILLTAVELLLLLLYDFFLSNIECANTYIGGLAIIFLGVILPTNRISRRISCFIETHKGFSAVINALAVLALAVFALDILGAIPAVL